MGAILIAQWLGDATIIAVRDEASVSEAREAVRANATVLDPTRREQLVAAASELAHNQLAHVGGGSLGIREISRGGIPGIEVIAADRGGGIADPSTALQGHPRTTGSLGVGLSAARRQVDEIDLDVRIGAGSCICLRTFSAPVPRSEVGVFARAHPRETVIGDHALVVRDDRATTIAVVDGLGHGQPALAAATRAVAAVTPEAALDQMFARAHKGLHGARGAVMALARITDGELEHASVGNVASRIIGIDGSLRLLTATPGTLGSVLPRRILNERIGLRSTDLVVLCSDGILTRFDLAGEPAIALQHPVAIARYIVERFARGTDDAIVVVVRG